MKFIRILLLCLCLIPTRGMADNAFDILEYRIDGNRNLLSTLQIEEAVYSHLGEKKTISDVEAARQSLEKAYHDAGYLTVLVDIPEQTVNSGIVHLRIVEGSVSKARVTGSRYYSVNRILAKVPELAEGNVPYFPALQKQLADVNKPADLKVTPVLRPGKTPGTVEAELKVADKLPLHANVELDNYRSANTAPLRLSGTVSYNNLWQKNHSFSLSYQTSPQNTSQVKVLSGTYLMPIGESDQLAIYGVASRSNVAAVGDMNVLGSGNILGARWVLPLPSHGKFFHSMTLGADYKDFKNDYLLGGINTGNSTPITYIPFSVGYSANLPGETMTSEANATLNFKFRGMGDKTVNCNGQQVSQFECMRFNAKPDYFYIRAGADTTVDLPKGLAFYGKVDGQIASGPLISNEEFTAGGANSVRGYFQAEQAGDDGIHASFELRGPQWAGINRRLNDLRSVVFVDAAHLRVRNPLPAQTATFDLAGVGFGLRLAAFGSFSMDIDLAWPLKATTYTQTGKPVAMFKTVLAN